ncbi:hypothetical protein A3A71_02955 [Candidatus Berkelbacteria bacterium RIFCSPLOWO2_01_FULL_50_28]|uniref:Clp R domain-containing protein n=1 Tax=Candidatus Berkelbacteria bacterium RIFCSPLOWO2_01_FULL_50_28 TaxID=1797471 RepID=A0A1F5EC45_9BACT|nr:MAG: hypothetical protein A2807_02490 [Candidatus Berkelbacteria bacterium RIFCSPHIGHO2_01_FULL_50_36]OGD62668.1 MAG: hypothetical protein A3F39_00505 [Candidatus Berkelbacteria bacterium RIFCSPHIGHO2_12_FULL_50_11]OGD64977.1 MAG: hypothetical protein A3A71_02955 [Candidatus Berkelbacteria bacterium RIFCSPLOWO2_01_FULL_50_28]
MKWNGLQVERFAAWRFWHGGVWSAVRIVTYCLGGLSLLVLLAQLVVPITLIAISTSLIVLTATLIVGSWDLYCLYLFSHQDFGITEAMVRSNPMNGFDYSALEILAKLRKSPTLKDFMLSAVKSRQLGMVFYRLGLSDETVRQLPTGNENIEEFISSTVSKIGAETFTKQKTLASAFDLAQVLFEVKGVKELLTHQQIDEKSLASLLEFYRHRYQQTNRSKTARLADRSRSGGFAASWSIAYTTLLDSLAYPLHASIAYRNDFYPIYSREEVVAQTILTLNKANGHNVLLVGEPGSGKQEIFLHVAGRVLNYQTKTRLDGQQVRVLDDQNLLSSSHNANELQALFSRLFEDIVRAGNVILFVKNLDLLLDPSGGLGSVDAANLLENFASDKRVQLVGTMNQESYTQLVRSNALLRDKFTSIEVPPPNADELFSIILSQIVETENRYQVMFSAPALKQLSELSQRYIKDQASPRRELNLAEEVAAAVSKAGHGYIDADDVREVVEKKVKVPIKVGEAERDTLLNLTAKLHERVVGQEAALKKLGDALLRARAGLTTGTKPIGSFLFLGPTGVGKTETAKALAQIYFGSAEQLLRLDMTEYADQNGLEKLLGVDAVKQPGALTVAVQSHPSAVLLLDEIEKSSDQVKNVLLQLLDEGRLTTNYGKLLDFTNVIVVATSNAGSDFIKSQIEKGNATSAIEKQLLDKLITERVYLPEFLNRFDAVIVYTPLSMEEMKQVVGLQLKMLEARLMQQKGLHLELGRTVVDELARRGYDPVFGARALQRVMQSDLETVIAREIIAQQPAPGTKLTINSL